MSKPARQPAPSTRSRPIARGERICLRHPLPADKAEFIQVRRRNESYLQPWEPLGPGRRRIAPAKAFARVLATANTESSQRFFVCRNDDGRIIGFVSLNQIFRGPFQNALMGYWIAEDHSGQGYGTEAVRLALDIAFGKLKLHRVEANLMPRNAASRGLVKNVGMRFEGLAKRYLEIAGNWEDHEHWAITVEDWQMSGKRRSAGSGSRRRARTMT